MERLAYSVEETAEALNVSRDLIYDYLRTGELESVKLGNRRLITREAINAFLAGRRRAA